VSLKPAAAHGESMGCATHLTANGIKDLRWLHFQLALFAPPVLKKDEIRRCSLVPEVRRVFFCSRKSMD
jgi:hypothetical protein